MIMQTFRMAEKAILSSRYPFKEQLLAALEPGIRITANQSNTSSKLGDSRFGGSPDLPDTDWPTCNGQPLDFLAQINLAHLRGYAGHENLPLSGFLYFFVLTSQIRNKEVVHRVLYRNVSQENFKSTIKSTSKVFKPCTFSLEERWTLNSKMKTTTDDFDDFYDLTKIFEELDTTCHMILGHPDLIQTGYDMKEIAMEYFHNAKEAKLHQSGNKENWRLLLQMDTDIDGPGWMWGDNGKLYFWIRDEDLRDRNFNHTFLMSQSF